jgi:nucleotide-binding universal stress UspA family protein
MGMPAQVAGGGRFLEPALKESTMYDRILVPLDGSATAERGLREAIGLAAGQKTKLSLLHVMDDLSMLVEMSSVASYQEMLNGLRQYGEDVLAKAKRAAEEAGVQADTLLREVSKGRVSELIVDEAKKAGCDLIVMGTHGRRGFSRLALGSEAELVIRTSPLPVLLVRLEEQKA